MKVVVCQQGRVLLQDRPIPDIKRGHVRIRVLFSTVSPGTEITTIDRKSEAPTHIGYSASGVVEGVGEDAGMFREGQRVACYGGPFVRHSEYLLVPRHLVTPVPEQVDLMEASTVGLGAIAMHAVRLAKLQFGETAVVVGLGIIGQLTARIASASGLNVIAADLLEKRRQAVADTPFVTVCDHVDDIHEAIVRTGQGVGADAVFHCAAGRQKDLLDRSFGWIRDRGKIIIVGDLQTEFTRSSMFRKEATLLVSRAGGPGRYDSVYEQDGVDYPAGFVRWTEGRNMQAYIRMLEQGRIRLDHVITEQYSPEQAAQLYESYRRDPGKLIGAVIRY